MQTLMLPRGGVVCEHSHEQIVTGCYQLLLTVARMKQLCDCEQHKGLNEFEQFPISGDVVSGGFGLLVMNSGDNGQLIPACAFRCPYCTYAW